MNRSAGIASVIVFGFALTGCSARGAAYGLSERAKAMEPRLFTPSVTRAGVEPQTPRPVVTVPVGDSHVTLTNADDGSSVILHQGQSVTVTLIAGPSFQWSVPWTPNDKVMERTSGSTVDRGAAQAAFLATMRGLAPISAKLTCTIPGCQAA